MQNKKVQNKMENNELKKKFVFKIARVIISMIKLNSKILNLIIF